VQEEEAVSRNRLAIFRVHDALQDELNAGTARIVPPAGARQAPCSFSLLVWRSRGP
jgi:hypothetical protein